MKELDNTGYDFKLGFSFDEFRAFKAVEIRGAGNKVARGKILIIDDEIGAREFLRDYFEDREFNVTIAEDGQAGFEAFQKDPHFDLILCDMLMPRMIGLQVLERVRALVPDQKLILMTGVKEDSMVAKAKALGCHLYLTKPVQLSELEQRVMECFPS